MPVAAPPASTPSQPSMPMVPSNVADAAPPRRMRVLIAEDDLVSRLRLERIIKHLGHDVLVASDGLEAWELFAAQGADVIVTDWLMPGIDGRELCQRVRAHRTAAHSPTYIIFTTVLEGQRNVRDALAAGADDYLIKPTFAEDIEARLIVAERVSALHRDRARALAQCDTLVQVARHFATKVGPERILSAAVAQAMCVLGATGRFSVTCSAGLAEFPSDAEDLLELYVAADTARSVAKAAGRDHIMGTR